MMRSAGSAWNSSMLDLAAGWGTGRQSRETWAAALPQQSKLPGKVVAKGRSGPRGNTAPSYNFPGPHREAKLSSGHPAKDVGQFFIVHGALGSLAPNCTIFGRLLDGLTTFDLLANLPVQERNGGEMSRPENRLQIIDIEIGEEGAGRPPVRPRGPRQDGPRPGRSAELWPSGIRGP